MSMKLSSDTIERKAGYQSSTLNKSIAIMVLDGKEVKSSQAVKLVANSETMQVEPITALTDQVYGIAVANVTRDNYKGDNPANILIEGSFFATAGESLNAGDFVSIDPTSLKAVKSKTGNCIIGKALEHVSAIGDIINIQIVEPYISA